MKKSFTDFSLTVFKRLSVKLIRTTRAQMARVSRGIKWSNLPNISSKVGDSPNNQFGNYSKSVRSTISSEQLVFGAGDSDMDYVSILEPDRSNLKKASDKCLSKLNGIIQAELLKRNCFIPKIHKTSGFRKV